MVATLLHHPAPAARGVLAQSTPTVPEEIIDEVDLDGLTWNDGLDAGIVLAVSIVAALITHRVVRGLVRRIGTEGAARFAGRFAGATVIGIGLMYALAALGVRLAPLIGLLGIGGIALAFALQDIAENLISGVMLQTKRNFSIGDQVVSNDYVGTIEDVNFRSTSLRTFDGTLVMLPNALVYKNPLEIHTAYAARRTTLGIGVAYDTDLDHAQRVILDAVGSTPDVAAEPPPEAWIEEFGDSSIDFAVWFWHDPAVAVEWRVRSAVAQRVKRALDDAGITIPFPQRVLHLPPDA